MTLNEFDAILNGIPPKAQPHTRKSSRSHGVIPRSKYEKLWMIPISPCDPNVMLFHLLASKIWARTDQNGIFFDNN